MLTPLAAQPAKLFAVLALTVFCILHPFFLCPLLRAQAPIRISGQVRDPFGRPVVGAKVSAMVGETTVSASTDRFGNYALTLPSGNQPATLQALAPGLESDTLKISGTSQPVDLALHPAALTENVTVTATRSSIGQSETANTLYTLDTKTLDDYPAAQLDDKLRQQAGFELFRRSSSRVQNPTSQGISLRGLGSTAVSRSLVLEDGVPLNDPFGGWIHWDELPQFVLDSVNIATGGGSDLYGSSALGGVVDVITQRPTEGLFDLSGFGGGQDTSLVSARADIGSSHLRQLLSADSYRTNGYILTAPTFAGPIDQPANVHYQAARVETDLLYGANRAFLSGNLLNEARNNGTRLQNNGTRLWRYNAGDDWNAGAHATGRARLFGSDEAYRQTFSSINSTRTTENLSRLQHVRTQELGASADASFSVAPVAIVTGADLRDIRATDNENPISSGNITGTTNTSARQRFFGGFGELLTARGRWSAALSLRFDRAWNLDTRAITLPTSPQPVLTPNRAEFIASPRLGLVRELGSASLHASIFRAFRTPSMNELYRTGQVGQEITQANSQLQSERATGWEAGAHFARPASPVVLGATYFGTVINRPVSAVILSTTATTINEKRENLGRIVSQGLELHSDIHPGRAISATLGYQYSHAVVTRFSAPPSQPPLVGKWIPQVPRHSFTAQLRAWIPSIAEFTLAARASGHAYDDSSNMYVLNHYFQLDLFARREFAGHLAISASLQNLTDQRPDVAKTPTPTLGSPFLAQGGIEYHFSRTKSK